MQTTGSWTLSTWALHIISPCGFLGVLHCAWILKEWGFARGRKQKPPVLLEVRLKIGMVSLWPRCIVEDIHRTSQHSRGREINSTIQCEEWQRICSHPKIHHIFPPPSNLCLSKTSSIIKVNFKSSLFLWIINPQTENSSSISPCELLFYLYLSWGTFNFQPWIIYMSYLFYILNNIISSAKIRNSYCRKLSGSISGYYVSLYTALHI